MSERTNKVFVLFEGHGGSQPDILAVFQTKEKLCNAMRLEFPRAKPNNRNYPSELYWEDDDGFWFKAVRVSFFREGVK